MFQFCIFSDKIIRSSVEWGKAVPSGNEEDLPRLFLKIYPTQQTCHDLESLNRDVMSINRQMYANDYNWRKRKEKNPIASVIFESGAAANTTEPAAEKPVDTDPSTEERLVDINSNNAMVQQEEPVHHPDCNPFELCIKARRNWKSLSVFLWPG